jgi:hypothetical protein
MTARSLDDHLFGTAPKRILALDGGGVRGALTLEYLARMETILRAEAGNDPDFRLSDYFDLIGGTSTGSIIATGLALGFSVSKLQDLYRTLAMHVFETPPYRFGVLIPKFARAPLVAALQTHFGDRILGSPDLRTGLMIMTKRLDTASPWPVHNNPRGRYFGERPGSTALANKHFLLWQIVRASTAAPHYFEPERLHVATDTAGRYVDGAFVDGGVSPFNNPALQLLMLATFEGYGLKWPLGTDKLLLVSVGTGDGEESLAAEQVMRMTAAEQAVRSLAALMTDCDALVRTMLQWLGETPTGTRIDREVGDLASDTLGGQKWLSYRRYNVPLEGGWLRRELGLDIEDVDAANLRAMDDPANVTLLARVGAVAAERQVQPDHFPNGFQPQPQAERTPE